MRRFIALLVVAVFTAVILLFFTYPEILDKVWLWIIGFIGYIWLLLENGIKAISDAFKNKVEETSNFKGSQSLPSIPGKEGLTRLDKMEERLLHIEKRLKEDKFSNVSN